MSKSASNGVAEKAIQEVEAQLRTMLLASEMRLGKRVPLSSPFMDWPIECVAEIINNCELQERDHRTSCQRKYGEKDVIALAEFVEIIHYMPLGATKEDNKARKLNKAEPGLQIGVYLGLGTNSNEYRVGAADGSVVKAYTLKRLPRSHQWRASIVDTVVAFPWDPSGRQRSAGQARANLSGDVPETVEVPDQDEHGDGLEDDGTKIRMGDAANASTRQFPLRKVISWIMDIQMVVGVHSDPEGPWPRRAQSTVPHKNGRDIVESRRSCKGPCRESRREDSTGHPTHS